MAVVAPSGERGITRHCGFGVIGAILAAWLLVPGTNKALTSVSAQEVECLALNVYWESRSEPEAGQIAVAHLTLNRTLSTEFPSTVCSVVRQGADQGRRKCQFSWMCDGKADDPKDSDAWATARNHALAAVNARSQDPTSGALYFHHHTVSPTWTSSRQFTHRIGDHLFYK